MARQFLSSRTAPIVETKAGKLRGFQLDGIYTFHGIKYADADRFQMPREVEPWEGVKDAQSYGFVCPLMGKETPNGELLVPHRYWPMDEHCQYLNVWTQSLDTEAKKPVMVWLHGGGYSAGSSIEQVAYDGDNLCRYGDVVVVSINHRLNILGYLDLSPFGEKYSNSGNAGHADIVAALQWIRDNIAQFGGDPDNVTLFGQSGGGGKVCDLMQMPVADGLFHKGIIQSGVLDGDIISTGDGDGTHIVNALMEELGFTDVSQLETVEYHDLALAYNKVSPAVRRAGHYVGQAPIANGYYVGDARKVGFREHAKTIPVMVGTVLGEFAFSTAVDKYNVSENVIRDLMHKRYGEGAEAIADAFGKAYPDKHLADVLIVDSMFRVPTMDYVRKKSMHHEAATYSYMFTFEFPYDGGKAAWHCSEIPFVFHNTDKVWVCNVEGVSDKLEEQMSSAWIHFARCGDPNCDCLPQWPASVDGQEATMIFDRSCQVRVNHDDELMELHKKYAPPFFFHEEPIQH